MINPANIMKVMKAKDLFGKNHPKFMSFIQNVLGSGIPEGTIIEMTVTKPGEPAISTNIKITQSDLDIMNDLRQ